MSQIQFQDKMTAKFLEIMNGPNRMVNARETKVWLAGLRELEAKGYTNPEANQIILDAKMMAYLEYSHVCGK